MNEITTVGVDLAKERISVHALDREARVVVAKSMSRAGFEKWIEALATPCVVAMEACGMAHYWARRLVGLGHQPRIICAEFVAPFRKGGRCGVQERYARCRGGGHRCAPARHAFRGGEERGAAGRADGASVAPRLDRGAYRADQSAARAAGRVWGGDQPPARSFQESARRVDRRHRAE